MYGCESWIIKKAEHQRIDAIELWCWRRFLRVPWTARRSNQSILNIHWKDWCWSWNSNILATWCKEVTNWKRPWCWEILKAGEGNNRQWDGWIASPTCWTWVWASSKSWWWTRKSGMLQSMVWHRVGHKWVAELNWTEEILGSGRSPGEGIGYPPQYSCLQNSRDRGAWHNEVTNTFTFFLNLSA